MFSKNYLTNFNYKTQKQFSAHKDRAINITPITSMLEEYFRMNSISWTHANL